MANRVHGLWQRGFTLIEVLMASLLLAMVLFGVFGFWHYIRENYSFSYDQTQATDEAERAVSILVRELRQMRPAENGSYGLVQVEDQALTFYADIDRDGVSERVRYFLEGSNIMRGVIEPTFDPVDYPQDAEVLTQVVGYVVNDVKPLFYYYNGMWPDDQINNPLIAEERLLESRYVQVEVAVRVGEGEFSPTVSVSEGVMLRSLKTN